MNLTASALSLGQDLPKDGRSRSCLEIKFVSRRPCRGIFGVGKFHPQGIRVINEGSVAFCDTVLKPFLFWLENSIYDVFFENEASIFFGKLSQAP